MYITNENADKAINMLNDEMSRLLSIGDISKDILCVLGEIVDIMKDIKELDKEDGFEGANSYGSYAGYGGNSNRGSYGSYAGGSGYSQRYNSYNNGGYSSRRGRRSMDSERDHIMSKMEQFMSQATNENERELVRRIMDSI